VSGDRGKGDEGAGCVRDDNDLELDDERLFLTRGLEAKPLRMGSCCVRAVVRVKRGRSSVTVNVRASQQWGSQTAAA